MIEQFCYGCRSYKEIDKGEFRPKLAGVKGYRFLCDECADKIANETGKPILKALIIATGGNRCSVVI